MPEALRTSGYLVEFDRHLPNGDLIVGDATVRTSYSIPVYRLGRGPSRVGRTEVMIRDDDGIWVEAVLDETQLPDVHQFIPRYEVLETRDEEITPGTTDGSFGPVRAPAVLSRLLDLNRNPDWTPKLDGEALRRIYRPRMVTSVRMLSVAIQVDTRSVQAGDSKRVGSETS
jgi:hypothetical protein